jgi:diguanylate cyclase (GGDEF)-like protein
MEANRDRLLAIIRTQSEIASSDLDSTEVMKLVVRRAQEITGATAGVIEIPEGDEMVYTVTTGEATPYLGTRLGSASSLSGLSLALNEVLYCKDSETDSRVDRDACRRVSARSMICVPLTHDGETVGVLKVYAPDPDHFDPDALETLRLLSDSISAQMAHASLYELEARESRTDALTGLFNRRAYEERRAVEASRAARYDHSLALCLFDLDGFKAVNDQLGHPAGDEVLKGVAQVIDSSRLTDDAFRIGGDEFAVLMPETALADAELVGSRLIAKLVDAHLGGGGVTASYGVAVTEADPMRLHDEADEMLLAAKDARKAAAAK